jgi:cation diffusion facilitator family transporter
MHDRSLEPWRHRHVFGLDHPNRAERALWWVIALTAAMMTVEVAAGLAFGSMALLADGLHMASHAVALAIAATAYVMVRRRAGDPRFSFGTGKINALGGFSGALLLACVAAAMAVESVARLIAGSAIRYDEALVVAVLGLAVNGACALLLNGGEVHRHAADTADAADAAVEAHHHSHPPGDGDHNLRSAYRHVLADALTSALAIAALAGGKLFGWSWLDPVMGIVGAGLVGYWCVDLARRSSAVLLDYEAPAAVRAAVTAAIEADGDARIADLHVWSIGPGIHAAALTVVAHDPCPPEVYRARLPAAAKVVHATIEVHRCAGEPSTAAEIAR